VGRRVTVQEELAGIEETLQQVEEVSGALQTLLKSLAGLMRATAAPPFMPNFQRAEEQLRTALNATVGAQKSLRRRLDLRRKAAASGRDLEGGQGAGPKGTWDRKT
jgi:hypothetical protein